MTWVKIDDGWPNNPKVEALSKDAKLLYICGLCYCGRNLTNGVLNKKAVKVVQLEAAARTKHVVELHEAGLWDRLSDGYLVHDYLTYNPSKEKVIEERRKARERMEKLRSSGERSGEQTGEPARERSPSPSLSRKTQEPLSLLPISAAIDAAHRAALTEGRVA